MGLEVEWEWNSKGRFIHMPAVQTGIWMEFKTQTFIHRKKKMEMTQNVIGMEFKM